MASLCPARIRILMVSIFVVAMYWISTTVRAQSNELVVEDIFGRRLNEFGLVLVDWEGYMANPAIKFYVRPPADAAFPATAMLSANHPRLYFDLPSQVGADGPTKVISFPNASARVPVYLANFPDRDTLDADHRLSIRFRGADGRERSLTLNVHEIDQDTEDPLLFPVSVTFAQDRTPFFTDPRKRDIVQQVATDWAYFVHDMNLDAVPAGAEQTFIWDPDGFVSGHYEFNQSDYTGYLLYAYGIHTDALRSGGEPSYAGGLQMSQGLPLPLKRSGGVEVETDGNFNRLGWFLTTGDADWWVSANRADEPNDLFSITHHEIGHSLIFNPAQPRFEQFKRLGYIEDPDVLAYHGSYPRIDASDHLNGEIDDASRIGAFGYEYYGDMPRRRWTITKLDLLIAQAIGYQLRPTTAFAPLSILTTKLTPGRVSESYRAGVEVSGGIPFYRWTLDGGQWPDGLSLNSFTGTISGTPQARGTYRFTLRVQEYVEGSTGVTMPLSITIE